MNEFKGLGEAEDVEFLDGSGVEPSQEKNPKLFPTKRVHPHQFIANLFEKLGKEEGIEVRIEPEWRHCGEIVRKDGSISPFRGAHFDLNGMGAEQLAIDKDDTAYFLDRAGYNVIEGKSFYSPHWAQMLKSSYGIDAAYQYAKDELQFPVVLKPNSASQGRLVCVAYNKRSFMRAARKICKIDRVFLVQELIHGHDYRIVVLDDKVLSAYERLPLSIVGDGLSTVDQLLKHKQELFIARGRDTTIDTEDFRIDERLTRQGRTRLTVLSLGESLALLDNCNLSTGGDSIDVADDIHPSYQELAIGIARSRGLRYCGVDLMVQDDIRKPLNAETNNYHIIELNSAPGIDHYAESGPKQAARVKEMYRAVFRKIAHIE